MNADLDAWSTKALAKQRRGYDGSTRLWLELENLYTKLFSAHDDRRGPLPPDALNCVEMKSQATHAVDVAPAGAREGGQPTEERLRPRRHRRVAREP